jgi:hypothetical protein
VNPDFRDLIAELNAHGVEFLIVGAHALAAHGVVRATKGMDVWVRPSEENAPRVIAALRAFGAPLLDLTEEDLQRPGIVFQIGVPPIRIDVITAIDGVEFGAAWSERFETKFMDQAAAVLSVRRLVQNKQASGRLQDLADLEKLAKLQRKEPSG